MIRKRGKNSWLISIYLGRDHVTGKELRYTETFYAPMKSLVQERERELRRQLHTPSGPKREIMTLDEWFDEWLERQSEKVTPATLRTYKSHVKSLRPLVGEIYLWDIDGAKLDDILHRNLGYLQPKSRRNLYATLQTAIKAAIKRRLVPTDALIGFELPTVPRKNRPVLSRNDLAILLEVLKGYKHGTLVSLIIVTGARVSEILGLTWDMVDLARGTITIDQAVDIKDRKLKPETKNENSRRTIELDAATVELLENHWRKSGKAIVRPIRRNLGLVFQADDGRPIKYGAVRKTLQLALKKADLPLIRIHGIRHSVITLLLNEGVPPIVVASLVGQDVATTVGTYAQKARKGSAVSFKNQ